MMEVPPDGRVPRETYNLGMTYERLEQPEMALQAYQSFVAAYPDFSKADLARERIIALGGIVQ